MKIITVEEHFTNTAISKAIARYSDADAPYSMNAGAPTCHTFQISPCSETPEM